MITRNYHQSNINSPFHPPFKLRITQKFQKKNTFNCTHGSFRYHGCRFTEIATKKWWRYTKDELRVFNRPNIPKCWPLARHTSVQTSCTDLASEWNRWTGLFGSKLDCAHVTRGKSSRHRAVNGFPACSPRLGQAYVPISNRVRVARIESTWTERFDPRRGGIWWNRVEVWTREWFVLWAGIKISRNKYEGIEYWVLSSFLLSEILNWYDRRWKCSSYDNRKF